MQDGSTGPPGLQEAENFQHEQVLEFFQIKILYIGIFFK